MGLSEKMKGDRELEKLLSEIPSPQSTAVTSSQIHNSHRHYYNHRQMLESMGFSPGSSNAFDVTDDGSSSLSSYDTPSHYHSMMNNNNDVFAPDDLGLAREFQRMKLGDRTGICSSNSRQFGFNDPYIARNRPVNGENYRYFGGSGDECVDVNVNVNGGFYSPLRGINDSALFGDKMRCMLGQRALAGVDLQDQANGVQSNSSYYSSPVSYQSNSVYRPLSVADAMKHCRMEPKVEEDLFDSRAMYKPYSNEAFVHQCGIGRASQNPVNPLRMEDVVLMKNAKKLNSFGGLEDTYIVQEKCLGGANDKYDPARMRVKGLGFDGSSVYSDKVYDDGRSLVNCHSMVLQPAYDSVSEVQGNIYLMAKDQHGCRFLQKKFEEGSYEDVDIIFNEIIDRIVELMMNPFGNYLIQKLLDVCHEEQRMRVVHMVTSQPGELVRISLNTHGTRVVQKLIETLSTQEQISVVVRALEPGFLDLIKDLNGNHVIQRCLQCLSNEDNKFIFDAAAKFCVDIATHRHGCCVLQRCIDHSNGEQRQRLISEICANGLLLAQDPFGNYVVQYILEKKMTSASAQLVSQFEGNYVHLSMQKFSSHVVEKCLKFYEESRPRIVHELLSVPRFEQVLQDQYANYVIQSALDATKGALHDSLVAAVRPHTILRTNPYCKKIFSRGLLKK